MLETLNTVVRRPLTAGIIVLAGYGVLSLVMNPHGYLGTDTGGKVATLESMVESGTRDPDIGYWAEEWDPEGELHPLFFTSKVGDRWVNVTTLPMIYAALPLYEVGGYRLALLIPMAGALAGAFAARAVARRVAGGDGWAAFWIAAVASPLVIYALDLWEHTVGVALVAWGVLAAMEWVEDGRLGFALVAGVLFGAAFAMRTEAGVYALVTVGVVGAVMLAARRWSDLLRGGALFVAGAGGAALGNVLLEQLVLGEPNRAARSSRAAQRVLSEIATRFEEGVITTTAISASRGWMVAVLGVGFVGGAILLAAWASSSGRERAAVLVAVMLGIIMLARFATGPGFVPGLVPATPFVAVALVYGWRPGASRVLTTLAVVAVPLVWAFQYLGGARPQWGGRYVLASGVILGAVGVAKSARLGWVRWWFAGAAVVITAFGLVWQSERTHEIAAARATLANRDDPVLVSRQAFFLRELGPTHQDRRWLTVPRARDVDRLEAVLDGADIDRFAFLQTDDQGQPFEVDDFTIVGSEHERWLRSDFTIFVYERGTPG